MSHAVRTTLVTIFDWSGLLTSWAVWLPAMLRPSATLWPMSTTLVTWKMEFQIWRPELQMSGRPRKYLLQPVMAMQATVPYILLQSATSRSSAAEIIMETILVVLVLRLSLNALTPVLRMRSVWTSRKFSFLDLKSTLPDDFPDFNMEPVTPSMR